MVKRFYGMLLLALLFNANTFSNNKVCWTNIPNNLLLLFPENIVEKQLLVKEITNNSLINVNGLKINYTQTPIHDSIFCNNITNLLRQLNTTSVANANYYYVGNINLMKGVITKLIVIDDSRNQDRVIKQLIGIQYVDKRAISLYLLSESTLIIGFGTTHVSKISNATVKSLLVGPNDVISRRHRNRNTYLCKGRITKTGEIIN